MANTASRGDTKSEGLRRPWLSAIQCLRPPRLVVVPRLCMSCAKEGKEKKKKPPPKANKCSRKKQRKRRLEYGVTTETTKARMRQRSRVTVLLAGNLDDRISPIVVENVSFPIAALLLLPSGFDKATKRRASMARLWTCPVLIRLDLRSDLGEWSAIISESLHPCSCG